MCRKDYKFMVEDIRDISKSVPKEIEIDVRLCIDFDETGEPSWIIRSGLVDYDQKHSELCGAGTVYRHTKFNFEADGTLENLISECLDQITEEKENE